MKKFSLAVALVGVLSAMDSHAALLQYFVSDDFSLQAFPDAKPYSSDNFGGLIIGGYEFQDTLSKTSTPSTLLSLPKFDSSLGELQSVSLTLTSSISPQIAYRYDSNLGEWVPNGYFPAITTDPYSEGIFPPHNDAGVSYQISAMLNLDALVPDFLPVVKGLTASASCYQSESIAIVFQDVTCRASDANGFGTSTFDWDFPIAGTSLFVGFDDLVLRATVDALFNGYCDYDDNGDYVHQDTCKVDPFFSWAGSVRVGYTYTDLIPGGGESGGESGGVDGGAGGGGDPTSVPEPSTVVMLSTGLVALLIGRRRRGGTPIRNLSVSAAA